MKQQKAIPVFFITVCLGILILLTINYFINGQSSPFSKQNAAEAILKKSSAEQICYGEAIRLFSYLTVSRAEREQMDEVSLYTDAKKEDRWGMYVNAAILTGLLPNASSKDETLNPESLLTCGQLRNLLFAVTDLYSLPYDKIKENLPKRFETVKEENHVLLSEFLPVYEMLVSLVQEVEERHPAIEQKELYFLGVSMDGTQSCLSAQDGVRYGYGSARDYSIFFQNDNRSRKEPIPNIIGEAYTDCYEKALVCEDELVYLKGKITKPAILSNVYLVSGADSKVTLFLADYTKEYETKGTLSTGFSKMIGDIVLENGLITKITLKPDLIQGKVLLAGKNQIEVEGYGVLPLHPDFHIYKVYDQLQMETANAILVGYDVTDFAVSNGQICAALIKEKIKARNIRVVLHTSNNKSLYHKSVSFTSDSDFVIDNGDSKTVFSAGETVTVGMGSHMLHKGRIRITPLVEGGKLSLTNVTRSYGIPSYRGSIEITEAQQGLVVVNELNIEEYLYAVVPSEMPSSYGNEALKVQAVCARSYAMKQLYANKYSAYGANVDDTVNCQVYNNAKENEASIRAVKETYGQVLMADGEIITAFYFSTSCGVTANVEDVWKYATPVPFLSSALQTDHAGAVDLSSESAFRGFMNDMALTTYDSGYPMYRWKVTYAVSDLSTQINQKLNRLYQKDPADLLTCIGQTDSIAAVNQESVVTAGSKVFASKPVTTIGTIKEIMVTKRGKSGIVKEMVLTGSKGSILLRYQSNVRSLFAPVHTEVTRLDGSTISGMSLLPSAFCYIDPVIEQNKVTGFVVTGGGFGHGVGMSQNGVRAMCKEGKTCEEVLAHYYPKSTIGIVY